MTINKFNSREQFKKRLLDFIYRKKSFYFLMVLCIVLIGIAVTAITMHNISSNARIDGSKLILDDLDEYSQLDNPDSEQAESSTTMTEVNGQQTDTEKQVADVTDDGSDASVSGDAKSASKTDIDSAGAEKSSAETDKSLVVPVFGKSIQEFATDKMVYSRTLEQWRTHSGIDIAADRGTAVKASADGIVADVKNDPRFGVMVIIDHQNGLKTIYANLASDGVVNPNQIVKQGDIVGSVGDTASLESADPTHLHFEVLSNDKPVDPAQYLPKSLINN